MKDYQLPTEDKIHYLLNCLAFVLFLICGFIVSRLIFCEERWATSNEQRFEKFPIELNSYWLLSQFYIQNFKIQNSHCVCEVEHFRIIINIHSFIHLDDKFKKVKSIFVYLFKNSIFPFNWTSTFSYSFRPIILSNWFLWDWLNLCSSPFGSAMISFVTKTDLCFFLLFILGSSRFRNKLNRLRMFQFTDVNRNVQPSNGMH